MKTGSMRSAIAAALFAAGVAVFAIAQPPGGFPGGPGGPGGPGAPGGPGGGFGGPGGAPGGAGRGGFGGFNQRTDLLKTYDKDGDGRLNREERDAARAGMAAGQAGRGGRGGGRGFGGGGGAQDPIKEGPKLTPAQVKQYGSEPLYDLSVVRTIFLNFDDADWEAEMAAFYHTDVDVPAKMIVDGKTYKDVGVHFRGASSFMMVPTGRKRSLNIDFDFVDPNQKLLGYKTVELLNSNGDPTFMRAVVYNSIATQYIAAPKGNLMRVVINGESWGIYQNTQAFNGDLIQDNFKTKKGNRWKVPGSPGAEGGLAYLGESVDAYKAHYDLKTKDDPKAWTDLAHLTKVLGQTPPEQLEKALEPILDVDGALKFLALDKALINTDGFWTRMSDYSIYEDEKGKFHIIPHDTNETLREPEGGGRGGRGGAPPEPVVENTELDPFAGSADVRKALLNKLLAVPALRVKYLTYMRDIAEKSMDWNKLEPLVKNLQGMISDDVKADGHKMLTFAAFETGLYEESAPSGNGPTAAPKMGLKPFFVQRRAYLLNYPEIKKLPK